MWCWNRVHINSRLQTYVGEQHSRRTLLSTFTEAHGWYVLQGIFNTELYYLSLIASSAIMNLIVETLFLFVLLNQLVLNIGETRLGSSKFPNNHQRNAWRWRVLYRKRLTWQCYSHDSGTKRNQTLQDSLKFRSALMMRRTFRECRTIYEYTMESVLGIMVAYLNFCVRIVGTELTSS